MNSVKRGVALKFLSDITKANPGYFVVSAVLNKAGSAYMQLQTPVIAWAFERGSLQPYPITLDGVQQGQPCILLPNGTVECIGVDRGEKATYVSVSEWLADAKRFFPEEDID